MALKLSEMSRRNPNMSIMLPKIEQEMVNKETNLINGQPSPKSQISEKFHGVNTVSFPSLTDKNNNQAHDKTKKNTRIRDRSDAAFHASLNNGTVNLQLGERGRIGLKLKTETKPTALKLQREKHIDLSPSSYRKSYNSLCVNSKPTTNNSRTRTARKRVQNCNIVNRNEDESVPERLWHGIQRQEAFDVDTSIEIGSIKKCCAWMDTWFDEDGRPKVETDDQGDEEQTNENR